MHLKALIVKDSPYEMLILKTLLEQNHKKDIQQIEVASTLDEAISLNSISLYNLCFLDVELNELNGFDLLPHFSPTHISTKSLQKIKSPFDDLDM